VVEIALVGLVEEVIAKFAVEVVLALFGLLVTVTVAAVRTFVIARARIKRAEARVARIVDSGTGLEREGDGVWLSKPVSAPQSYDFMLRGTRAKIIMVGNLKGGVGKTIMAA